MKKKIIKIKLTDEQLEQLQPLFDQVEKYPLQGMIIGQAGYIADRENGDTLAYFAWLKPNEVIARVNKVIAKANDKTIKPA